TQVNRLSMFSRIWAELVGKFRVRSSSFCTAKWVEIAGRRWPVGRRRFWTHAKAFEVGLIRERAESRESTVEKCVGRARHSLASDTRLGSIVVIDRISGSKEIENDRK